MVQQAEEAEKSQPAMNATCRGIVEAVIELDVEEEDRKRTWKADAAASAARGSVETARAIYEHALRVFPGKKSIWRAAAGLEKAHGTRESLDELLKRAVKYCPQVTIPVHNSYSSDIGVLEGVILTGKAVMTFKVAGCITKVSESSGPYLVVLFKKTKRKRDFQRNGWPGIGQRYSRHPEAWLRAQYCAVE